MVSQNGSDTDTASPVPDSAWDDAWARTVAKAAAASQMEAFPLWTPGGQWVTAELAQPDRGILPHDGSWMVGDLPSILWFVASDQPPNTVTDAQRTAALRWSQRLNNRTRVRSFASVSHMFYRGGLVPLLAHGAVELHTMVTAAAQTISDRFHSIGYMKSFGSPTDAQYLLTTIDDVINLCIPLWYAQKTGNDQLSHEVLAAVDLISEHLVRPDGSAAQVLLFDEHGAVAGVDTYQGYSPEGCWSRGLAWGIYGYAAFAALSGRDTDREAADRMASYWMDHVQGNPSPIWDFEVVEEDTTIRDSFAGSLGYAGLLELAALSAPARATELRAYTAHQMKSLSDRYVVPHEGLGILRGAALDVPHDHGVGDEAAVIVGDSYYAEALWRLRNRRLDTPLLQSNSSSVAGTGLHHGR